MEQNRSFLQTFQRSHLSPVLKGAEQGAFPSPVLHRKELCCNHIYLNKAIWGEREWDTLQIRFYDLSFFQVSLGRKLSEIAEGTHFNVHPLKKNNNKAFNAKCNGQKRSKMRNVYWVALQSCFWQGKIVSVQFLPMVKQRVQWGALRKLPQGLEWAPNMEKRSRTSYT